MCQSRHLCAVNHVLIQLIPILGAIKVTACQCKHMYAYEVGMNHIPH